MSGEAQSEVATVPRRGRALLIAYRVLAYLTAIMLIPLVFVATPLDLIWHRPALAGALGFVHGMAYMVYLVVAFVVSVRLRLPIVRILMVLLAGTIPFAGFFAERYVTHAWERSEAAS
jgi:integral membrane protein